MNELIIQAYSQKNRVEPSISDELAHVAKNKMDEVCKTWLDHVKAAAIKGNFSTKLLSKDRIFDPLDPSSLQGVLLVDKERMKSLTTTLQKRYGISSKYKDACGVDVRAPMNSFIDASSPGRVFNVTFYWSPLNTAVYEKEPLFDDIPADLEIHMDSIQKYLQQNICEQLKSKSNEFVPAAAKKIDEVCKTWLDCVEAAAKKRHRSTALLPARIFDPLNLPSLQDVFLIDEEGMKLLTYIFKARYDIDCTYKDVCGVDVYPKKNSLMDVLPPGRIFDVTFRWSDSNTTVNNKLKFV